MHLSLSISSSFDLCVCVCLKLGSGRLCHLFADCVPLALAAATSLPDMAMENDGNDEKNVTILYSTTVQPIRNTCFGRRMLKEG